MKSDFRDKSIDKNKSYPKNIDPIPLSKCEELKNEIKAAMQQMIIFFISYKFNYFFPTKKIFLPYRTHQAFFHSVNLTPAYTLIPIRGPHIALASNDA